MATLWGCGTPGKPWWIDQNDNMLQTSFKSKISLDLIFSCPQVPKPRHQLNRRPLMRLFIHNYTHYCSGAGKSPWQTADELPVATILPLPFKTLLHRSWVNYCRPIMTGVPLPFLCWNDMVLRRRMNQLPIYEYNEERVTVTTTVLPKGFTRKCR